MNIVYVPVPFMDSFVIDGQPFPIEKAKAAKKVEIELYAKTKTRISITLIFGQSRATCNIIPKGSEKFKFDGQQTHNYFSGNTSRSEYWRALKNQGMAILEEHLKNLVAEVFSVDRESEFEISVRRNSTFNQLNILNPVSANLFRNPEPEFA
jgi:hypothetical protein